MVFSFQILGRQSQTFVRHGLVVIAMLGLSGLAACGQKGPLFIAPQTVPLKLSPVITPPATPAAVIAPATPASASK